MTSNNKETDSIDEGRSIQLIREMIQVSQKKIKNDGILFIMWGWLMVYNYLSSYILRTVVTTYQVRRGFEYAGIILAILAFAFTIWYIFRKSRRVTTYIGISLRYVWISLIICLSLTNMIIFNVIHEFKVELQHPIFMVFIAFAIVVTGGILRYRLIITGGIVFAILAYISSYLNIERQMLAEAIAWLIAFVLPGHIMYANRKK